MDVTTQLANIKSSVDALHRQAPKPPKYGLTITLAVGAELARAAGNKALADKLLQRAANTPAMTSVPGWAQEVVASPSGQLVLLASHSSAFAQVLSRSAQIGALGQGQRTVVAVAQPNAAKIISEGEAIPIAAAALSSLPASPHKLASMVAFTSEAANRSSIATVCRSLLQQSLALGIDEAAFTDSGPLGLFQGLTPTSPEASAIEDTKALLANIAEPSADTIFVVHPARWPLFLQSVGPTFPYAVLPSTSVGDGLVCIDPQGIAAALGEALIDISTETTAHMSDTPGPVIAGSPTRSGWQTDTLIMRTLLDLTWAKRAGSVSHISAVNW